MKGRTKKPLTAGRLDFLHFKNRAEWHNWLKRNHARAREAWLTHYRNSTDTPGVNYAEAVEEALCFGWIDGKKKSVDSQRYAYRYTPRGPKSSWSVLNIRRMKKLIRQGRVAPAGLQAFRGHEKRRARTLPTVLSKKLQKLFEGSALAWKNFEQFSPGYKRLCIAWVASAKQEETQLRRLNSLIEHSGKASKIKFM